MITIYLMGGLGNQLFQIFATIAYGIQHSHPFIFSYNTKLETGMVRPTYWHNFLSKLIVFTTNNSSNNYTNELLNSFPKVRENGFHYTEIQSIPSHNSFSLFGYYQSYKYFETYKKQIYSMIALSKTQSEIRSENANYLDNISTISMHFRLGDYKEKQHCHPIMSREYYEKSLETILHKQYSESDGVRVLYFCEAEDNTYVSGVIQHLKHRFSKYTFLEFVKVEDTMDDWKQMVLMSLCHHNIIANSSFSWWGAYFNQSDTKQVCYPSVWFGPAMHNVNTKDLYPDNWTKISA